MEDDPERWPLYPRPLERRGRPDAWGARRAVPGSGPKRSDQLKEFGTSFTDSLFTPRPLMSRAEAVWSVRIGWACLLVFAVVVGLSLILGVWHPLGFAPWVVGMVLLIRGGMARFLGRRAAAGRRPTKRSP